MFGCLMTTRRRGQPKQFGIRARCGSCERWRGQAGGDRCSAEAQRGSARGCVLEENRPFGGFDGDVRFAYAVLLDITGSRTPVPALAWPDNLFSTPTEVEG
jgi:hypothetical protein